MVQTDYAAQRVVLKPLETGAGVDESDFSGDADAGVARSVAKQPVANRSVCMRSQMAKDPDCHRKHDIEAGMVNRQIAAALAACVFAAGCGILAEPEIVSGDANEVAIKAGTYMNPAELAELHCKDHGKSPVLTNVEDPEILGRESVFYFDCR